MLRQMKVLNTHKYYNKNFQIVFSVVTNENVEHAIVTLLLFKYDLNSSTELIKVLFLS
jgi:hypothetical protein